MLQWWLVQTLSWKARQHKEGQLSCLQWEGFLSWSWEKYNKKDVGSIKIWTKVHILLLLWLYTFCVSEHGEISIQCLPETSWQLERTTSDRTKWLVSKETTMLCKWSTSYQIEVDKGKNNLLALHIALFLHYLHNQPSLFSIKHSVVNLHWRLLRKNCHVGWEGLEHC